MHAPKLNPCPQPAKSNLPFTPATSSTNLNALRRFATSSTAGTSSQWRAEARVMGASSVKPPESWATPCKVAPVSLCPAIKWCASKTPTWTLIPMSSCIAKTPSSTRALSARCWSRSFWSKCYRRPLKTSIWQPSAGTISSRRLQPTTSSFGKTKSVSISSCAPPIPVMNPRLKRCA